MNNISQIIKEDLAENLIISKTFKLSPAKSYFLCEKEEQLIQKRKENKMHFLFDSIPFEEKEILCFNYENLTVSELAIAYKLIEKIQKKYEGYFQIGMVKFSTYNIEVNENIHFYQGKMSEYANMASAYGELKERILKEFAERIYRTTDTLNDKNKVLRLCNKEARRYNNLAKDLNQI